MSMNNEHLKASSCRNTEMRSDERWPERRRKKKIQHKLSSVLFCSTQERVRSPFNSPEWLKLWVEPVITLSVHSHHHTWKVSRGERKRGEDWARGKVSRAVTFMSCLFSLCFKTARSHLHGESQGHTLNHLLFVNTFKRKIPFWRFAMT